jgi:hypothetical protein
LDVRLAPEILDLLADARALGVPEDQACAVLFQGGEEVQLLANLR